jgi:hypothetical protein
VKPARDEEHEERDEAQLLRSASTSCSPSLAGDL